MSGYFVSKRDRVEIGARQGTLRMALRTGNVLAHICALTALTACGDSPAPGAATSPGDPAPATVDVSSPATGAANGAGDPNTAPMMGATGAADTPTTPASDVPAATPPGATPAGTPTEVPGDMDPMATEPPTAPNDEDPMAEMPDAPVDPVVELPGVPLFNGTDLSNWAIASSWPTGDNTPPLSAAQNELLFQWENGMVHVYPQAPDASPQPRATLLTLESYSNYKFSVEYMWGVKKFAPFTASPKDAGVLFHVTGNRSVVWPASIEFQIWDWDSTAGRTGDLWMLNTRATSLAQNGGSIFIDAPQGTATDVLDGTNGFVKHQRSAEPEPFTEWALLEMEVTADSAVYFVNGHLVNKVFDIQDGSGSGVTEGPIALQAEYNEIFYRNARIEELP